MTNQQMRDIVNQLDVNYFKIGYKTGVHLPVIEDFFNGKTDTMDPKDRARIEKMLKAEKRKSMSRRKK